MRVGKRTVLIGVEGQDDLHFIRHIKSLFKPREPSFKIYNTYGGSPIEGIKKLANQQSFADYDKTYFICDVAREEYEKAYKESKKYNIKVIGQKPYCLEGLLLTILSIKHRCNSEKACKRKLKVTLGINMVMEINLRKLFPKVLLCEKAKEIPPLNEMINIFVESQLQR